ncbi:MAG: GNAT family N-acetyltransferase [Candidatus Limnocylindrales bacterium]
MITVRPATLGDADRLRTWANDPVTRAAGAHPAPIDDAVHRRWLADRLGSTTDRLYIGLDDGRPIGQVRLEILGAGRVEVGISVAPEARRRGVGRALLDAALAAGAADDGFDVDTYVARIRPENAASVALFGSAGFRRHGTDDTLGVRHLVYERRVDPPADDPR